MSVAGEQGGGEKARERLGLYIYNHELLPALSVDLWGAIGGQASTLDLFKLAFDSCFGGGRVRGKEGVVGVSR